MKLKTVFLMLIVWTAATEAMAYNPLGVFIRKIDKCKNQLWKDVNRRVLTKDPLPDFLANHGAKLPELRKIFENRFKDQRICGFFNLYKTPVHDPSPIRIAIAKRLFDAMKEILFTTIAQTSKNIDNGDCITTALKTQNAVHYVLTGKQIELYVGRGRNKKPIRFWGQAPGTPQKRREKGKRVVKPRYTSLYVWDNNPHVFKREHARREGVSIADLEVGQNIAVRYTYARGQPGVRNHIGTVIDYNREEGWFAVFEGHSRPKDKPDVPRKATYAIYCLKNRSGSYSWPCNSRYCVRHNSPVFCDGKMGKWNGRKRAFCPRNCWRGQSKRTCNSDEKLVKTVYHRRFCSSGSLGTCNSKLQTIMGTYTWKEDYDSKRSGEIFGTILYAGDSACDKRKLHPGKKFPRQYSLKNLFLR